MILFHVEHRRGAGDAQGQVAAGVFHVEHAARRRATSMKPGP